MLFNPVEKVVRKKRCHLNDLQDYLSLVCLFVCLYDYMQVCLFAFSPIMFFVLSRSSHNIYGGSEARVSGLHLITPNSTIAQNKQSALILTLTFSYFTYEPSLLILSCNIIKKAFFT